MLFQDLPNRITLKKHKTHVNTKEMLVAQRYWSDDREASDSSLSLGSK